jgi:hypothetical protein
MVFESCPFEKLVDAAQRSSYACAMRTFRVAEADAIMVKLVGEKDVLTRLWALEYFGEFPREDVVASLVAFIESEPKWTSNLYVTVKLFIASPKISEAAKRQLQELIDQGKVQPPPKIEV